MISSWETSKQKSKYHFDYFNTITSKTNEIAPRFLTLRIFLYDCEDEFKGYKRNLSYLNRDGTAGESTATNRNAVNFSQTRHLRY